MKGFVENLTASCPEICSPQAFFGLSLEKKTKSRLSLNQNPWGPISTDYQATEMFWSKGQ